MLDELPGGATQCAARPFVLAASELAPAAAQDTPDGRPRGGELCLEPAIKRPLEQGCGRVLGGHLEVRIDSGLDGVLVEEVGAESVDGADSCLFELGQRKAQPLALRRRPCLI